MSKYWPSRVLHLSGWSRISSRCFQQTFYSLLLEGWSNWNDEEIFETFAGAFDLAPNHDEIRTFWSLIRRSLRLMLIRSGTTVMGVGGGGGIYEIWMGFSALHPPNHPWLDYRAAVLISYNCINMICREIGIMCLTQQEELSAIEDGTQKRRDQITADQREQRFQIAETWRYIRAVPLRRFHKCAKCNLSLTRTKPNWLLQSPTQGCVVIYS